MFNSKSITFDQDSLSGIPKVSQLAADLEFVEELRSGDARAFDNLVLRYSGEIYGLLFRITGNAEEAADLTQDTFLNALRAVRSFRGDAELKTWLFRIAINQSRNRFRWWTRRRRDRTISLDAPAPETGLTIQDSVASDRPDPEKAAIQREREHALALALSRLPEAFRVAVIMCDIHGWSYEEISDALGITLGTVKSRISRGRSELRERLKDI